MVGGEGVSGWECAGKLRTGGRVRRVWMVLDGSKEASLPSCGDKPSLALQQRVTQSKAQRRILGQIGFKRIKKVCLLNLRGVPSPHQAFKVNKSNAPPPHFRPFTFRHTSATVRIKSLSGDLPVGYAAHY